MKQLIDWSGIQTVLLDMDGTLLDLYFDNYFWQNYLPRYWGKQQDMDETEALQLLKDWYRQEAGSLSWYCLDFWTQRLGIDVLALKADVEHLITWRPGAEQFLEHVMSMDCDVYMVTNAHQKLIQMKIEKTGIDRYFDKIISAHDVGYAKENLAFWKKLEQLIPYEKHSTLLIDDNLEVLQTAQNYGLDKVLTIVKPDSRQPDRNIQAFHALESFSEIINC